MSERPAYRTGGALATFLGPPLVVASWVIAVLSNAAPLRPGESVDPWPFHPFSGAVALAGSFLCCIAATRRSLPGVAGVAGIVVSIPFALVGLLIAAHELVAVLWH